MSGKTSRQRRVDAVNAARIDAWNGKPAKSPFDNERQTRIYVKYHNQLTKHRVTY